MSFVDYQQELLTILSTTDPIVANAAATANQYTEMLKAGELSQEEYKELLLDLQRTALIDQNMAELESKEKLNVAINGLISLASLV